jgi:hypothetical protein
VDDAALVGVVDGIADFGEEEQGGLDRSGRGTTDPQSRVSGTGSLIEGDAIDELHDEVVAAVGRHAGVMDCDDAGVAEGGDEFGLALEAESLSRRGEGALEEHLEGDPAACGELEGLVDDALAAAVKLAADLVALDVGGWGFGDE